MNLTRWALTWALTVAATIAFTTPAVAQNYKITDLGVLSTTNLGGLTTVADTDSTALGINASGSVVGVSGVYDTSYANLGFYVQHAFLWTPSSPNGTTGTMTWLGGLPGDYCFSPASTVGGFTTPASFALLGEVPFDINSSGQVVGYSYTSVGGCANLAIHGVLWQNGTTTDISFAPPGILGGAYSFATSINDAGQIVGYTAPLYASAPTADVWLYDGTFHDLGSLPSLPIANPNKINAGGTIVGFSSFFGSNGISNVVSLQEFRKPIQATNMFRAPGWPNALANKLQSMGIMGRASNPTNLSGNPGSVPNAASRVLSPRDSSGTNPTTSLGFVHTGTGTIQPSDATITLGGPNSSANGINKAGVIVGGSSIANGATHAFQINLLGAMFDLGTFSPDPLANSSANAINGSNDIVGWSDVDPSRSWISSQHAVLWDNAGEPMDLNSLLLQNAQPPIAPPVGKFVLDKDGNPQPALCPTCWELISASGINDLGQIVGVGLTNCGPVSPTDPTIVCQRHAFLLTPPCVTAGGDSDGDGLCDDWEINGYTAPDGTKVDLHAMGANPKHKDIFVQSDYMSITGARCAPTTGCVFGHTHEPDESAITQLINAFAEAPVKNLDGKTGITLHIDCGPNCIMNPVTQDPWGDLSQAKEIPEISILGSQYDPTCTEPLDSAFYCWAQFDALKAQNFSPSRAPIFHYMIFAHDIGIYDYPDNPGTLAGSTGIGKNIPDSSFVVSLGSLDPGDPAGTFVQQAGTFMHELGHNLGLHHGGYDDTNNKPNYLSVMNYLFQGDGLWAFGGAGTIDYSKFSLPDLNEIGPLDESKGLNGGAVLKDYGTAYYCPGGDATTKKGKKLAPIANGPIDWNCNGFPYDPKDTYVDLTALYIKKTLDSGEVVKVPVVGPLHSSEDWSHLIYNGGAIGALGVGALPATQPNGDPESAVPPDPEAPFRVEVVSPGLAQVLPGTNLALSFTLSNAGIQSDTYSLSSVSNVNWWNTSGIPDAVTLPGGASQQIIVPVSVSGCVVSGTRGKFTIKAVSQSFPSIADTGVAVLTALSNPSGSVAMPNVVGLTQAAAQAAILSAGLTVGTVTAQSSTTVPAGTVISQSPIPCGTVPAGTPVSLTVSSGGVALITVPNVVGQTQVAAIASLTAAGLTFGGESTVGSPTIPAGDVVSQNPPAGSEVTPGTFYFLYIASATPAADLTPNVVGDPISTAVSAINAGGLNLGVISNGFSLTIPAGTVMSQVPAAGSPTTLGSYVNVTVSFGNYAEIGNIPNIVGDTQANAIYAILTAGFSVGSIGEAASNTVPAGLVILQSPLAGGGPPADTPVSFSISTGRVGSQSFVVPNVYGLPQPAASSAITAAGLTVGTITSSQHLSMPVGDVFSQTPQPGAYAVGGSAVNLSVSAAAAQYTVPDLVTTLTLYSTAYADIIAAGLTPGTFTPQISYTVGSDYVISQSPAAGAVVPGGSVVNVTYSLGIANYTVPSVVGENQVFAAGSISTLFVSVTREPSTTVPDSFVISQNPPAGAQAPFILTTNLVVSSGGPVTAAVPNVVGTSITDGISATGAEPTLNAAGFAVGSVTYQPSSTVPPLQVISQNPPAGAMAAWDTSVSLVYSSGPPVSITVPNLVGQTLGYAVSALYATSSASGAFPPWTTWTLTTQSSPTVPAGVVISQNPSAGTVLQGVTRGTDFTVPVTFVVSAGPNPVPTYSLLTQFGDYGGPFAGDGQFFVSASLAIDPNTGNILAGDSTGRIQIFDRNGNFKGYFGGQGVQFVTWTGPGTNPPGTFYPTGTGGGLFGEYPIGLAVDPINGNVVALDMADRVLIFNSAGVFQSTFGSPGTGPGQFDFSTIFGGSYAGVAIDPVTENILVTDWANNRVQIFSSTGMYQGQFGTFGAGDGQFNLPIGIAIDPATRNIVVMDRGNGRVEIFNSSGAYLSQFGAPAAALANWTSCACVGLAIDAASHNIIVQGAIGGGILIFDSKGNYLSQFGGFGTIVGGPLAVDPVSHHIVTFGLAGNEGGTVQIFGAPVAPTPTSTALTSSLNPANFGQSVTFTATVTGSEDITGTVQFFYGDTSLGSPVTLAAGMASLTTSTLPVGTDSITAVYSGDTYNAASYSPVLNETITGSTSTALATSVNPVIVGHPVTFTATETGSSPIGTVQFMDRGASLGSPVILAAGVATLTTSTLAAGTHPITAVYSGDSSNPTSTSAVLSEMVLAATTTTVVASLNPATGGHYVTFTATVTGSSPTGTIQFMDGAASLGVPVTLTAGVATFATATLSAGTHLIEAVYSGDSTNFASTSSPLSEIISSSTTTTTTMVTSLNPSVTGQSVTFTATVAGNNPTGTVQFLDSASSLGSPVNLTGNTATLKLSTLSAGAHSITATYGGDSSNFASASTPLNEVVSPSTPTTTLVASLNPAATGQSITLGATVTGYNPTGTIRFFDGVTPLGTPVKLGESVTLVSPTVWVEPSLIAAGNAALTSSLFSVGTHSITAVYSGDKSNSTSTSAVLSEVISGISTPIVVTPPASISIPATQAGGATSSASPVLAAFLSGGSATGGSGSPLVALAPQIGGASLTSATLFPVGTTTVAFRFQDANGNIGTATSTVTVTIGTPRITGSIAGIGNDPSGAIYANVVLTNSGTGNARNLTISTLTFRTLSGTGTVTYNTGLSQSLPLTIGNLDVGATATTRIYLNVPSTATRISITENGSVQDVLGTNYNYSTAEALIP